MEVAAAIDKDVLSREQFFVFLDHELNRARRYQNFLSLLFFKIEPQDHDRSDRLPDLRSGILLLLKDEIRDSDLLSALAEDKLAVLLPYADFESGFMALKRLTGLLEEYDFPSRGVKVGVEQFTFPMNGANPRDFIQGILQN
jgi:PleD family two-component response regulator